MDDTDYLGRKNHETFGELVSLSTSYHHILVIALAKNLNVSLQESQIVFAPRTTGDLMATIKGLLNYRSKQDKTIPIDKILNLMDEISQFMSRTNHVHGEVAMHAAPMGEDEDKMGVTFTRYDIKGSSFKVIEKTYDSSAEFKHALIEAKKGIHKLQPLIGVTYDDILTYLNLKFE